METGRKMKANILVVDDDRGFLDLIKISLMEEGFSVRTADCCADAVSQIRSQTPDLILLDIILPDISGIMLTRQLKTVEFTKSIPIILLTAKDSDKDVIDGLTSGADDYVTKPISFSVLKARIDAVLRRAHQHAEQNHECLVSGDVKLYPARHVVTVDDKAIKLTRKEFRILQTLLEDAGRVFTRNELVIRVFGGEKAAVPRLVDVHVAALRKKLGTDRQVIETVHGAGYKIVG